MFYVVYKITNRINGKFYIGSHKTKDPNDSYMGSGRYLQRAQKKYGIENFTKEILHVFDNPEEMFSMEAKIVNEDFLAEENTYNLKIGGMGGFDYINANPEKYLTEKRLSTLMPRSEQLRRWKEKWNNDPEFREKQKEHAKLGNKAMLEKYTNGTWFGRKHSDETKAKMKTSAIGRGLGETNSQYGTIWITNGIEKKKIKNTDVIPDGWHRGRK
jgi:hypothetical protein